MQITTEFKDACAEFMTTWIQSEGISFNSPEEKQSWLKDQMENKTPVARACIRFAMIKCGV